MAWKCPKCKVEIDDSMARLTHRCAAPPTAPSTVTHVAPKPVPKPAPKPVTVATPKPKPPATATPVVSASATPTFPSDLELVAGQEVGFELECHGVKLNMSGVSGGDTYGSLVIYTTLSATGAAITLDADGELQGGIPRMKIELEERKGNENPYIEAITAPYAPALLKKVKTLLLKVIGLANGKTMAEWATAATAASPSGWDWASPGGPLADCKFYSGSGAELVQSNTDLPLDLIATKPKLIQSMLVGADRLKGYNAARTCATSWIGSKTILDTRSHIAGLLTYALYFAYCEARFFTSAELLGKDRAQPLMKVGCADLARIGLNAAEQTALFAPLLAEVNDPSGLITSLCKATSMTGAAKKDDVSAIQLKLWEFFFTPRDRYAAPKVGEKDVISLYALPINYSPDGVRAYDVIEDGKTRTQTEVTAWGNFVRWTKGVSGTPSGKPVKPKLVSGKTQVVVETRKNEAVYNKAYFHDL